MGIVSVCWGGWDDLWTHQRIGFSSTPVLISGSRIFRGYAFLMDPVVFLPFLFKLFLLAWMQCLCPENLPLMSHAPPAPSLWFQWGGPRILTPSRRACDSGLAGRAVGCSRHAEWFMTAMCFKPVLHAIFTGAPLGDNLFSGITSSKKSCE